MKDGNHHAGKKISRVWGKCVSILCLYRHRHLGDSCAWCGAVCGYLCGDRCGGIGCSGASGGSLGTSDGFALG